MRDGQGRKLSAEEIDKVKAAEVKPDAASVNQVSVDPGPGIQPMSDPGKASQQPGPPTAPKF